MMENIESGKKYDVLDCQILIKITPEARRTASGIILPEVDSVHRTDAGINKGVVVALGPMAFYGIDEPTPKVGDIVIFARYSGSDLNRKFDDTPYYRVMSDKEVLLIERDS